MSSTSSHFLAGGGGSAGFLNGVGRIQDGDEDVAVSDRKTGGRDLLGHLGRRGRGVQGRHVGLEIPEHRLERAPQTWCYVTCGQTVSRMLFLRCAVTPSTS